MTIQRIILRAIAPCLLLFPTAASAQGTEPELLRAILCELKELRAAVRQGQAVAPLIESEIAERREARKRLQEILTRRSNADQAVQQSTAELADAREKLRNLPIQPQSEQQRDLRVHRENRVKELERDLQLLQQELGRASLEAANVRAEIAGYDATIGDIQRQLRSLATAGDVCGIGD